MKRTITFRTSSGRVGKAEITPDITKPAWHTHSVVLQAAAEFLNERPEDEWVTTEEGDAVCKIFRGFFVANGLL